MASDPRAPRQPLPRQRIFDHNPVSVREAREFATDTLIDWGIPDRRDDIRLCVSELATNALLYGSDGTCGFLVVMSIVDHVLRVEVHDTGTGVPRPRMPDDTSDTGRGLFLVEECADGWGVDEAGQSKAVWAEFKTVPDRHSRSEVIAC
jgi:anti-sigma regulatory factor (Ser/Thr protein kinase)